MPDGNFNEFPIPYNTTDDPSTKANKTTTINGLSLAQNRVLKSAQFSEAITGEKMLANLTYTVVSNSSMAQSIKLVNDVYLDASGVTVNSSGKKLSDQISSAMTLFNSTLNANDSRTFTLTDTTRGMLFVTGAGANDTTGNRGIIAFNVTSSGVVAYTVLVGATTMTITEGTNSLTINNTGTTAKYISWFVFAGTVTANT